MKRLLFCILIAAGCAAQNWPQFRGPDASGVADGKPLAVKWNAEKNEGILWKTAIPGLAHSSPVVWGDRVFVSTAVSSLGDKSDLKVGLYGDVEPSKDQTSHSFRLYALDKKTGKIVWEKLCYDGVPKTKRHTKSSYAAASPVTDGKVVVVLFGSEGLYAYDFSGKQLWKQDLGVLDAGWFYDPDYQWGTASSPVIYKDMVIVQADIQKDSFIAAYSLKTGKQVWKTARVDELPSWGSPTIYKGPPRDELVTQATHFIRGYDPMTGKELWKLGPNSEVTAPTPIIANNMMYVTNGYRGIQPIFAIKPGASGDISLPTGKETGDFIAWSKQHGGPYMPTPVIYDDIMYICQNAGIVLTLNAKTGEKIYQERFKTVNGYSGSPVAGDGKVYFPGEDGDVNVIKAGSKYELLSSNSLGEPLMASPAISDGIIFFRAQHTLFAVAPPAAPAK